MRLGANRDILHLEPFAGLSKTTCAQAKACATKIFEPCGPLQPRQVPQLQSNAVIPAEGLKPLYDFTIDYKTCQAKLAATQGDLADERQKTTALTRERDDAVRVARGGSAWRRIVRAAKRFLIGAAVGAVAAKAAH